ncbi:hypothetical protein [Spongiimicrobium salis]|uniref:hypothetical protein n=1 Tax=Spongiimicrobium salis TaxID=1667022 RepID=UPI00374D9544
MKYIIWILYFIPIGGAIAQPLQQGENSSIWTNGVNDEGEPISFRIGTGVLIPQQGREEFFGISPMLETSALLPLKRKKAVEFVLQFAIPTQKEAFVYQRTIDTVNAKATLLINGMFRFKKALISKDKTGFNIGLGIGISNITTNARNPFYTGDEDEKKYENITAILFAPNLEWEHRFLSHEIAISIGLQYAPYKVEGALREDIGEFFYVPKISYRF